MPKVQCPNCKEICYKTTDAFNPDIRPNRTMIEMLDPWRSWGWDKSGGFMASDLECPLCCAPLAPSGRLTVVPDDYGVKRDKSLSESNQEKINQIWENEQDEQEEEEQGRDSIEGLHRCPICGKTYKYPAALKKHIRSHREIDDA